MFEPFIPPIAQTLQDAEAIALLQRLQRKPISVPQLMSADQPTVIPTAVAMSHEAAASQPPLLLLHGFDSSLLEFRRLMPRLVSFCPVYALDLLGFGFTAHLASVSIEPRTIRQHLYHTWKTVIRRPVTLVGASLGGAIAIDFALAYPDCVENLILIDSVGFSGSFPIGKWLGSPLLDWGADWLIFRKDLALRLLNALPVLSFDMQDAVLCASLHQHLPGWKQSVISFTKSGGYSDLPQHISHIRQPTLIVWGRHDASLGTDDAHKFKRAIGPSRLVWIEDAGHTPHMSHPAAVAREIIEHIESSSRRA